MPMKWSSKALLAKIEASYGTDPVPTGAANAILATNVTLSPMEGEDVTRNLETPYLAADPTLPVGLRSMLTFDVEAVGSAALGTAPSWGPLLRACGVAQTVTASVKVEYAPITDNHESVAIYMHIDGTRHVLLGTRGNATLKLNAQGIPVWSFTMMGLFAVPTEQAKPTPDYTSFQAPTVATKANTPTFTVGGIAMVMRDFELNLGNDVQPRMLIGSESILIVDRAESLTARVEALPVTTYNPYTIAQNSTPQVIQLVHGTVAARRWTLDIAKSLQNRLTGYEVNQNIAEWPLGFIPQPTVGNDQWKLTIA
jgi:hypothetical protein